MTTEGRGAIRVVLCAPSTVRRAGLEAMIHQSPGLKLAASLPDRVRLRERVSALKAGVVVIDLEPGDERMDAADIPAVVLVDHPSGAWVANALRNGARAILSRDLNAETLHSAIGIAERGLVLLQADTAGDLVASVPARANESADMPEQLTARELEVMRMLAEGLSNRDIGTALGISDHTVKFHITSIFDKLDVSTRTEAVMLGVRLGLILV